MLLIAQNKRYSILQIILGNYAITGKFMDNTLREKYDRFAKTYEANRGTFDISEILDLFYSNFENKQSSLLDLGCGIGEPVARYFVNHDWHVTGVDFSDQMIKLASKYVPEMETITGNIMDVEFEHNKFDAITATYSLFHIPSEYHRDLFIKLYQWLKPNGYMLFTYATEEYTGAEKFSGYKTFIDTELFYSHKTPSELYDDLEAIGFAIKAKEYHTIGGESFLWVTVKKP